MKPYYIITELLSKNGFTNSQIFPFVDKQLSRINGDENLKPETNKFLINLTTNLKSLFEEFSQNFDLLGLSTILDPRFKDYQFTTIRVKTKVEKLLNTYLKKFKPTEQMNAMIIEEDNSLMQDYEDVFGNVAMNNQEETSEYEKFKQIEKYDIKKDPLNWWHEETGGVKNKEKFPTVWQISKLVNVPSTSTESERTFSKTGYLLNTRRSLLSESVVNISLFLSDAYKRCSKNN